MSVQNGVTTDIARLPKEHQGGATMFFCGLDKSLTSQPSHALRYELLVNITMFMINKLIRVKNNSVDKSTKHYAKTNLI